MSLTEQTDRDKWLPKVFRDLAAKSELHTSVETCRAYIYAAQLSVGPPLPPPPDDLVVASRASLDSTPITVDKLYEHVQEQVAAACFSEELRSCGTDANIVVYTDGSCLGVQQECFASAAGAAVLSAVGSDTPIAVLEALVPRGSPANSQTGEFLGCVLGNRLASIVLGCFDSAGGEDHTGYQRSAFAVDMMSDCSAVVDHADVALD